MVTEEIKKLQNEIDELKAEIQELNVTHTWWVNRYNSLSNTCDSLTKRISNIRSFISKHETFDGRKDERYLLLNQHELELLEDFMYDENKIGDNNEKKEENTIRN